MTSLFFRCLKCTVFASLMGSLSAVASEGKVVVFQPQGEAFSQVTQGIVDDMSDDIDIIVTPILPKQHIPFIEQVILSEKPNAVVLLGNKVLDDFIALKRSKKIPLPPALATAALFVGQSLKTQDGNTAGISAIRYEVPLVTSLVNVRSVLKKPLERVGVIYREALHDQMQLQAKFCDAENIELVTESIAHHGRNTDKAIKKALKRLSRQQVDAYLLLNDNALISTKTLKNAWIPQLRREKVPVVVGMDLLIQSDLNLGSFSIAPDHYGLGLQAASTLWEWVDNDWKMESIELLQPLSVKKKINRDLLKKKSIHLTDQAEELFNQ